MDEFRLPDIGEGVMEGEIIEWQVGAGQDVRPDQPLLSVLTDKATVEIASPRAGRVQQLLVEPGQVVKVGQVLLRFAGTPEQPKHEASSAPPPTVSQAAVAIADAQPDGDLVFSLPEIGEGVMEGEVLEWHLKPGDALQADAPLVSVLTDKATVEITCPSAGRLVEILAKSGQVLAVGAPLMRYSATTSAKPGQPVPPALVPPALVPPALVPPALVPVGAAAVAATSAAPRPGASAERVANPSISAFGIPLATPAVRRLAGQLGVDLKQLHGSGPHARITRADVEKAGATSETAAVEQAAAPSPAQIPPTASAQGETREKIRGLRKAIYLNMAKAKRTVPHFTYVEEVEMDKLVALRDALRVEFEQSGAKLTFLPFIAKAIAYAMRKFPIINASVDDAAEEIVFHSACNIGIATATQAGLMVPVVREVQDLTLLEIAQQIAALSERARARKSSQADLSGGTFTITSLGKLGGLLATPIINHPEVAIFGVHNMVDRPVVRAGQIVIRKMMNVAVAFDHRVVDGDVGAAFTQEVKSYLEEPSRFLLHLR